MAGTSWLAALIAQASRAASPAGVVVATGLLLGSRRGASARGSPGAGTGRCRSAGLGTRRERCAECGTLTRGAVAVAPTDVLSDSAHAGLWGLVAGLRCDFPGQTAWPGGTLPQGVR